MQTIPGMEKVVVTGTGFNITERAFLQNVTLQLGAGYLPDLVHRSTNSRLYTTHLVCKSMLDAFGTQKYMRALEWGLPIVTQQWVLDCLATGNILDVEPYKTDNLQDSQDILRKGRDSQNQMAVPLVSESAAGDFTDKRMSSQANSQPHAPQAMIGTKQPHLPRQQLLFVAHDPAACPGSSNSATHFSSSSQISLNCMLTQQHASLDHPTQSMRDREQQELRGAQQNFPTSKEYPEPSDFSFQKLLLQAPKQLFLGSSPCSSSSAATPDCPFRLPGTSAAAWQSLSVLPPTHHTMTTTKNSGICASVIGGAIPISGARQQDAHDYPQHCTVSVSPLPPGCEISMSPLNYNEGSHIQDEATVCIHGNKYWINSVVPGGQSGLMITEPGHDVADEDQDDIIIPGTQLPDDDFEDATSPQSLLMYLRSKMSLEGPTISCYGSSNHVMHEEVSPPDGCTGSPMAISPLPAASHKREMLHHHGQQVDAVMTDFTDTAFPSSQPASSDDDKEVDGVQPAFHQPGGIIDDQQQMHKNPEVPLVAEGVYISTAGSAPDDNNRMTYSTTKAPHPSGPSVLYSGFLGDLTVVRMGVVSTPPPIMSLQRPSLLLEENSLRTFMDHLNAGSSGTASASAAEADYDLELPSSENSFVSASALFATSTSRANISAQTSSSAHASAPPPPSHVPPPHNVSLPHVSIKPEPGLEHAHEARPTHLRFHSGTISTTSYSLSATSHATTAVTNKSRNTASSHRQPLGPCTQNLISKAGNIACIQSTRSSLPHHQPQAALPATSASAYPLVKIKPDPDAASVSDVAVVGASVPIRPQHKQLDQLLPGSRAVSAAVAPSPRVKLLAAASRLEDAEADARTAALERELEDDISTTDDDTDDQSGLDRQSHHHHHHHQSYPLHSATDRAKAAAVQSISSLTYQMKPLCLSTTATATTAATTATATTASNAVAERAGVRQDEAITTSTTAASRRILGNLVSSAKSSESSAEELRIRRQSVMNQEPSFYCHRSDESGVIMRSSVMTGSDNYAEGTTSSRILAAGTSASVGTTSSRRLAAGTSASVAAMVIKAEEPEVPTHPQPLGCDISSTAVPQAHKAPMPRSTHHSTGDEGLSAISAKAKSSRAKSDQREDCTSHHVRDQGGTNQSKGSPVAGLVHQLNQVTEEIVMQGSNLLQEVQSVEVLKELARPPRSNTAKDWHSLASHKGLAFAEQVKVRGIVVSCKERSKRATYPMVLVHRSIGRDLKLCSSDSFGSQATVVVAEPFAMYLKDGEWWLEFSRLLSSQDVLKRATLESSVRDASLPVDLIPGHELLKVLQREHCRLACVCGETAITRTKKLPSKLSQLKEMTVYQRYVWDAETMHVLTDAPVSEFLAD
ncbi:hypothetical protein CEUSTIGMA_g6154.t1 [Chlamydomonas eustigma]|uniref:BRCT domain-containing protein n=1 Tax=Chlamydomonas eustigma TaxID=1157962 RepID=A0A250X6P5_9CHLO|nr:hypothetical protein CEUSTIGMA_g6154.t1 [Chlamydomonas eustigma]|eukprot:GAX78716.1 hypothetical protein CEUSTIGMA_g6154.t1 [Chlamydomonas eustigma]